MEGQSSLLWFRKGLRLHDNPALGLACQDAKHVYPVFVLDPWFLQPDPTAPSPGSARVGVNRIRFLLDCLTDLDHNLTFRGSKLLLVKGNPTQVIPSLLSKWKISKLCFEFDTEPYALERDEKIMDFARRTGIQVHCPVSHTIFNPDLVIMKNGGKPPLRYQSFCKLLAEAPVPLGNGPSVIPPPGDLFDQPVVPVPTLEDLGYSDVHEEFTIFRGGETEGLKRLDGFLSDKKWICEFEKPKGNPTAFRETATTVLSPYLKFGCVSSRFFYARIKDVYSDAKSFTKPPVSLEGQLLWREFFYTAAYGTPNFDKMVGNAICKQIPWKDDEELLRAWRDARTGYPWIDAAMTQLRQWGWMHHLARHAVACFLTRGDMFVHWEKGRDVFDRLLIDADWSLNNGNWLWLSASAFFNQYHRIYSPVSFGKKYDPEGAYIRHFLPVLRDMPKQYIYEPWKAPLEVQQRAKCIIGSDYPRPVLDHGSASKKCRELMSAAYALNNGTESGTTSKQVDELSEKGLEPSLPRKKQKQTKLTDFLGH